MKKVLSVGLLMFSTVSFAKVECYLNNAEGKHFELSSDSVETGLPYGAVRIGKERNRDYVLMISKDGIEKLIFFKGYLSITEDRFGKVNGNLVCL